MEGPSVASSFAAPIVESLSPPLSSFEADFTASAFSTTPFVVAIAIGRVFSTNFDRAPCTSGSDASDADDVETNDNPVTLRSSGGRADSSASETLAEEGWWSDGPGMPRRPDGHSPVRTDPKADDLLDSIWAGRTLGRRSKSCCQATILS